MDYSSPRWFSFSTEAIQFSVPFRRNKAYIKLFNLFNRHTADGEHWWGAGLLQFGSRHLFFVGFCGVSILYIGKTK